MPPRPQAIIAPQPHHRVVVRPEASQPITLLHVSDPQFGRHHRFGNLALPPPDDTFDTL